MYTLINLRVAVIKSRTERSFTEGAISVEIGAPLQVVKVAQNAVTKHVVGHLGYEGEEGGRGGGGAGGGEF